jgi:red chlorophyll catabolite reductase
MVWSGGSLPRLPSSGPPVPSFSTLPLVSRPWLRLPGALRLAHARPSSLTVRASAGSDAAVACAPEMPQHEVVRALAAEAEARLGSRLLPSAVPADVAEFRNGAGNAVGSLDVRRGAPGSSVQFLTLVAGIR